MRATLLAFVLLLGCSWMVAQNPAAPDQEGNSHQTYPAGSEQTVTGCLSQSNGEYVLTSKDGMMYHLSRDSSKLAGPVGHEIRVTGMVVAKSGSNGTQEAGGANGGSVETLRVNSFKHISKMCSQGESGMSK